MPMMTVLVGENGGNGLVREREREEDKEGWCRGLLPMRVREKEAEIRGGEGSCCDV